MDGEAKTAPVRIPAGRVDVPGFAELAGVESSTVYKWLRQARERDTETGEWPAWIIPRPDSSGRPYLWETSRKDVRAFLAKRREPPRPPELDDPEWLLREFGHPEGADGRPVAPDGKGRDLTDIGRELKIGRDAVRLALVRQGIPVPQDPVRSRLADVTFEELEAAYQAAGSLERAGGFLTPPVSHMTFRKRWRELLSARAAEVTAAEAEDPMGATPAG